MPSKWPIYCQRSHFFVAVSFPFFLRCSIRQGSPFPAYYGAGRGSYLRPAVPTEHATLLPRARPSRLLPASALPHALAAPMRLRMYSRGPPGGVGASCAHARRPGSWTLGREGGGLALAWRRRGPAKVSAAAVVGGTGRGGLGLGEGPVGGRGGGVVWAWGGGAVIATAAVVAAERWRVEGRGLWHHLLPLPRSRPPLLCGAGGVQNGWAGLCRRAPSGDFA